MSETLRSCGQALKHRFLTLPSGTNKVVGALDWVFTDAANATEDADLVVKLMAAGAAAAEVARFTSTKRLGIGVVPAVNLDVAGSGGSQMRIVDGGAVDLRMQAFSGSSAGIIGTISAHDTVFVRNNAEAFRADAAGVNLALGKVIKVNSVQVVGARDTGWVAMTGTSDKATAYATGTITLPQLAGRVMALQAALTIHGLIGA